MGRLKNQQFVLKKDDGMDDDMGDISVEESESETEVEEDAMVTEPTKNPVYNKEGLLEQLGDISWPENAEWIHKLSIDFNEENMIDVNDDLLCELAFYTQALEGTRQAFEKLQSMELLFLRPPDYYAEMEKTDALMGRLLVEKKKIEEADERRKAREAKRITKEVQAQKIKERSKQKKEEMESVKKWRKQRQQNGFAEAKDDDMVLPFEDGNGFERSKKRSPGVAAWDRSDGIGKRLVGKGNKGGDNKKKGRKHKNSKFGFGGRKGMRKQNTAETTNDFKGFNKGDSGGNKKRKRRS